MLIVLVGWLVVLVDLRGVQLLGHIPVGVSSGCLQATQEVEESHRQASRLCQMAASPHHSELRRVAERECVEFVWPCGTRKRVSDCRLP
jgi:hypothetical protein